MLKCYSQYTYGIDILRVTIVTRERGKENLLCTQKVQVHHAGSININASNAVGKEGKKMGKSEKWASENKKGNFARAT